MQLPQLNVPGLLTPHGRTYPLGAVDGGWAEGQVRRVGGGVGERTVVGMENEI